MPEEPQPPFLVMWCEAVKQKWQELASAIGPLDPINSLKSATQNFGDYQSDVLYR
ncbi:MAG: hypothetical protein ACHBN1_03745 [Heteroscytonema crispum UTEX LB 1556]